MGRLLAVGILVASLLAGCSSPTPADPPAPRPEAGANEPEPVRGNKFLLDSVYPPGAQVSDGAEPIILADQDGKYLWIGDTSGLHISEDNGTTWKDGAHPFFISADGWPLAQDATGALYFATTSATWIDVARSTDGGKTATVSRFVDAAPVADRPWLAARGDGEVTLVFYAFGRIADEACARSTDRGVTWLDRAPLAGSPNAGSLVYGPSGELYWANDGATLHRLQEGCGGPLGFADTLDMMPSVGETGLVQTAVSESGVYVAIPGAGNGDIVVAATKDFSTVTRLTVSPPELKSNTYPVISAHGNDLAVAWYGSEQDGNPAADAFSGEFNVYLAIVRDFWGTPSIEHVRITEEPNHVGGFCMAGIGCTSGDRDLLDYFGIDHDRWGGIHIAYGHDGSGSNAVVRYAHVAPVDEDAAEVGSPEAPLEAEFTVKIDRLTVTTDASSSSGGPATYTWDWGDGSAGSGVRATHKYARAGTYDIELTVEDDDGLRSSTVKRVQVTAPPASAPPSTSPPPKAVERPSNVEADLPPLEPPEQESPGPGLYAALAAVGLAALRRRSRF